MNETELGSLGFCLGCEFKYAEWRPYHQDKLVAYKKAQTCLEGYNTIICVWTKKQHSRC